MEQVLNQRNIKVIKSVQAPDKRTHIEVLYGEYPDDGEVIKVLHNLENQYSENPSYEKLHGYRERLSLSFRHRGSKEIIRFSTED